MRKKDMAMTGETKSLTRFKVHTTAGVIQISAETPKQAGDLVKARDPSTLIRKIKVVKGDEL